jgi:ABC-type antimicrobial peptide transport system permease subunit
MKKLGITSPDSAIGRSLVVSVRVSTIDSGLAHILVDRGETLLDRVKRIHFDSLLNSKYRGRVIRTEVNETVRRFLNGFINAREEIRDTLIVCGVRDLMRAGRLRIEPMIIPVSTVAQFSTAGLGGSPTEIFAAMSSGTLFSQTEDASGKTFSQVTIDFDPKVMYKAIRDSVEALGFRTFSFAAEFEQIQRVFLYFDLALGVVGLIALITASLGIVNTMVMSITERRREIGVLKSLGADELDIRGLFLVESGVIGVLGTVAGLFFGWIITRIVSAVAQAYMRSEGIPVMDLFALPIWLILIALGVGVGVSVLAGFYPAARAARVDPVEALRNE